MIVSLALTCLAMAVYHEARDQSIAGQVAVAQVVMNRVESDHFPDDICSVVYQGGERPLNQCQFSFFCDGKDDKPYEEAAWEVSILVADAVMHGSVHASLTDAVNYHAWYVDPYWPNLEFVVRIGDQLFYRRT